jgi:hypothetical protein
LIVVTVSLLDEGSHHSSHGFYGGMVFTIYELNFYLWLQVKCKVVRVSSIRRHGETLWLANQRNP